MNHAPTFNMFIIIKITRNKRTFVSGNNFSYRNRESTSVPRIKIDYYLSILGTGYFGYFRPELVEWRTRSRNGELTLVPGIRIRFNYYYRFSVPVTFDLNLWNQEPGTNHHYFTARQTTTHTTTMRHHNKYDFQMLYLYNHVFILALNINILKFINRDIWI